MNRDGRRWKLAKHERCIAPQLVGIGEKDDLHCLSLLMQAARGDETIPAVVPFAAKNDNPLRRRMVRKHVVRDRSPRVLHQGERGNAIALAGSAVDRTHFRRGYDLHDC